VRAACLSAHAGFGTLFDFISWRGSLNSREMQTDLPNIARSKLVELLAFQKSARSPELIE
jgi:hypothetical protein